MGIPKVAPENMPTPPKEEPRHFNSVQKQPHKKPELNKDKREFRWWENEDGSPSVKLTNVIAAFSFGCTDKEACIHADITERQLYYYQETHPEFVSTKALLKEKPVLKARKTIVDGLDKDENARWYLERKRKEEFSPKMILTGTFVGGRLPEEQVEEIDKILAESGFNKIDQKPKELQNSEGGEQPLEVDVFEEDTKL